MDRLQKKQAYRYVRTMFSSTALAWEDHHTVFISPMELTNLSLAVSFDPELQQMIVDGVNIRMSGYEGIGWVLTVDRFIKDRLDTL